MDVGVGVGVDVGVGGRNCGSSMVSFYARRRTTAKGERSPLPCASLNSIRFKGYLSPASWEDRLRGLSGPLA